MTWFVVRASARMARVVASKQSLHMTAVLVCASYRRCLTRSLNGCRPLVGAAWKVVAGCVRSVPVFVEVRREHTRCCCRSPSRGRAACAQGSPDRHAGWRSTANRVPYARDSRLARSRHRRTRSRRSVTFSSRRSRRVRAQGSAADSVLQRRRSIRRKMDPQLDRGWTPRTRSRR